jgi:molecular chaperone DnaK (HSP70)
LQGAIDDGRLRLPAHRTAQGVATDFMRALYKLLEHTLIKEFGPSVVDSTPIDCWVTVPAVWSDQAQNSTKLAALEAGFGSRAQDTISVITEPEAAAIAVLKNMTQPEALNKPRASCLTLLDRIELTKS